MLLQRQAAAGLDDDPLDLVTFAEIERLIRSPRTMHLEVIFGHLRRDRAQFGDQTLEAIGSPFAATPIRRPE